MAEQTKPENKDKSSWPRTKVLPFALNEPAMISEFFAHDRMLCRIDGVRHPQDANCGSQREVA